MFSLLQMLAKVVGQSLPGCLARFFVQRFSVGLAAWSGVLAGKSVRSASGYSPCSSTHEGVGHPSQHSYLAVYAKPFKPFSEGKTFLEACCESALHVGMSEFGPTKR